MREGQGEGGRMGGREENAMPGCVERAAADSKLRARGGGCTAVELEGRFRVLLALEVVRHVLGLGPREDVAIDADEHVADSHVAPIARSSGDDAKDLRRWVRSGTGGQAEKDRLTVRFTSIVSPRPTTTPLCSKCFESCLVMDRKF